MLVLLGIAACHSVATAQTPLGTTLSYQGQLNTGGSPLNGSADFEFRAFDAPVGGNLLGTSVAVSNIMVVNGVFTAEVDFGPDVFEGQAVWLEIRVRSPHDPTNVAPYETLSPRQALTAAPAAQTLVPGAVIEGAPEGFLGGVVSVVATEPGIAVASFVEPGNNAGFFSATTDLSRSAALVSGQSAVYGTDLNGGFNAYFEQGKSFFGGNVGIGTETPAVALDIMGDMGVSGRVDIDGPIFGFGSLNMVGPIVAAGGLSIASPISAPVLPIVIDVAAPAFTPSLQIDNSVDGTAAIELSTPFHNWIIGQNRSPGATSFDAFFIHDADAGLDRMRIPPASGYIEFPHNGLEITGSSLSQPHLLVRAASGSTVLSVNNNGLEITGGAAGEPPLLVQDASGSRLLLVNYLGQMFAPNLPNIGDERNMQYNDATGVIGFDTSSRRYKENITPLRTDFARILLAEPYIYTRKGGNANQWEIGYMAEDLEAIGLTPLVEYNGEGLPDGVNYEKSVLFLNEVIKSQQAQIQALEARLSALEAAEK